jgi:hypothetical protein
MDSASPRSPAHRHPTEYPRATTSDSAHPPRQDPHTDTHRGRAAAIGSFGLGTGEEAIVVAVYVVVASITLIVPVVGYLAAPERMAPVLDSMKAWLLANNATVMAVLFAVLGAKVLGDGITILTR